MHFLLDVELSVFITGYLMAERETHASQSTFECVDEHPEYVFGQSANTDGGTFQFQRPVCPNMGLPCPPYYGDRELTCVVCNK